MALPIIAAIAKPISDITSGVFSFIDNRKKEKNAFQNDLLFNDRDEVLITYTEPVKDDTTTNFIVLGIVAITVVAVMAAVYLKVNSKKKSI